MDVFDAFYNMFVELALDELRGQSNGVLDRLGRARAVGFDANAVDAK
jgi:hypothetical protein